MTVREMELIRLMRKVFGEENSRPIENMLYELEKELEKPERQREANGK